MERAKAKRRATSKRKKAKRRAPQTEIIAVDKVFGSTDLLTKILNLLPLKPLVRSKAVSNHWLTLISDPHFLLYYSRLHHTGNPPSSFSQFYYDSMPISLNGSREAIPRIDYIEGARQHFILHSCNGLILQYYHYGSLAVFNPTTNKHKPLPIFAYCTERNTILAFDPLISFNYKVVSFYSLPFDEGHYSKSKDCMIDIFSSESASWNRIFVPPPSLGVTRSKRFFWNGAIHWIIDKNFHVRLDVNEENFTWNQIPTDPNTFPEGDNDWFREESFGYMGEGDCGLLLIKLPRDGNRLRFGLRCTFTILEMKKDSDCWVPKHHVNLEKLLPMMGLIDTYERFMHNVLYVISESDKDCFRLVLGVGKIILYSVNNRNNDIAMKVLEDFADATHNPLS